MHGNPSVLDVNALVLTVGPGSKASRRKLLRICDHHTSMYLQMRAPTPTVQSCGKCILHTRKSVAYATPPPPVPTPIETFIVWQSPTRRATPHANPYVGRSMRTEGELVHNENAYVKSVNRLNYFCIGAAGPY